MVMDIPPALVEHLAGVDIGSVLKALEMARSFKHVAEETWGRETLQDILHGKVAIPDKELNKALTAYLGKEGDVSKLKIASHEDNRLEVHAKTKHWGTLKLNGTLNELVHNDDRSQIVYTIEDRGIENNKVVSWIFERVSLSLVEKLFGRLELADDLPSHRDGNTLTIDMKPRLSNAKIASYKVKDISLLDILTIDGVTPHEGYVELDTSLRIPPSAKALLQDILRRKDSNKKEREQEQ